MTKLVQQVPKALDSFILIGFEQVTMPSDKDTLETYLVYKSDKSLEYVLTLLLVDSSALTLSLSVVVFSLSVYLSWF